MPINPFIPFGGASLQPQQPAAQAQGQSGGSGVNLGMLMQMLSGLMGGGSGGQQQRPGTGGQQQQVSPMGGPMSGLGGMMGGGGGGGMINLGDILRGFSGPSSGGAIDPRSRPPMYLQPMQPYRPMQPDPYAVQSI